MGQEATSCHEFSEFELLTQAGRLPSVKTVKWMHFLCAGTLLWEEWAQGLEHSLGEIQRQGMGGLLEREKNGLKWGQEAEIYKELYKSSSLEFGFILTPEVY